MYAGALDERFKAVVPVCSVGNYQAYLGAACCMCEVVPGALRFTEEWGVLGLIAPRGADGRQRHQGRHPVLRRRGEEVAGRCGPVFKLLRQAGERSATRSSSGAHDYSKAMREAMYGWMTLHLKGEGDGNPIPEPEIKTEDPETLRCYPGDTRPADWMTIPRFAAAEGRKLLKERTVPDSAEAWNAEAKRRRQALVDKVFGGFPERSGWRTGKRKVAMRAVGR